MRPRPVIREPQVRDHEDPEPVGANPESIPTPVQPEDSEKAAVSPEPVMPEEDLEKSEVSLEPVTGQEDTVKPESSTEHVIRRKPMTQKRLRKVRVIKPKVRVVQ